MMKDRSPLLYLYQLRIQKPSLFENSLKSIVVGSPWISLMNGEITLLRRLTTQLGGNGMHDSKSIWVETEMERQVRRGEERNWEESVFLYPITWLPHGSVPEIRMKKCGDSKRLILLRVNWSALAFFRSVVGCDHIFCARDVTLLSEKIKTR